MQHSVTPLTGSSQRLWLAIAALLALVSCSPADPLTSEADKLMSEADKPDNAWQHIICGFAEPFPTFPGDVSVWLKENLQYPEEAVKDSIEGRVVVKFSIDTVGTVGETQVIKGVHPALDNEALRVVNAMPQWKPAMLRGTPQQVWYTLPITFRIPKSDSADSTATPSAK